MANFSPAIERSGFGCSFSFCGVDKLRILDIGGFTMARRPKPKKGGRLKKKVTRPTVAQQAAVQQAYRSERAGHEMIRRSPPPKRSISDIVFGAARGIGQRLRGAVVPRAERRRQEKIRQALPGAGAGAGAAGTATAATAAKATGRKGTTRQPQRRKRTRRAIRRAGR